MRTNAIVAGAAVVLCASVAFAQDPRPRPGGFPGGWPMGRGVDILGVQPIELSEPVTSVPFSAEMVTETIQVLTDGNRIEQRSTGSIARDGQGRIRREQELAGFGGPGSAAPVRIVTISDPTERRQYRLDEARRTAWVLRGLPPPPPRREPPAAPDSPALRTETLAPALMEGVKAEGTRTVFVLPAGSMGNERPIEVLNERWYSPELRTVIATRRVDPRFGEVTFRLLNIVRAEPAADLFTVPSDFTVREEQRFPMPRPRP